MDVILIGQWIMKYWRNF